MLHEELSYDYTYTFFFKSLFYVHGCFGYMCICDHDVIYMLLQQWHKCDGTTQPLHEIECTFDNVNEAKNLKLGKLCVHFWLWFGSFFFVIVCLFLFS